MLLVTASTGKLGRLVIEALLRRVPAAQIVAGARSPQKAAELTAGGVEVRELDYTRPETATAALRGVERLLLISGNEGDRVVGHRAVIDAAKAAGVELIAYTSVLHADSGHTLIAKDHVQTERYLQASGVPFTLLRNGWYNENYAESVGLAVQHGATFGAGGAGRISPAARADYAEAAALVLTSDGHAGKTYELAGDASYTLAEIAAEISRLSGKPVTYNDLPISEYAATLEQFGLPAPVATLLSDADGGLARGELFDESGTLRGLIGRATTPLASSLDAALQTAS